MAETNTLQAEIAEIVAKMMNINAEALTPDTVLTVNLIDLAVEACIATGMGIVLNQGDTFGDLLEQLN